MDVSLHCVTFGKSLKLSTEKTRAMLNDYLKRIMRIKWVHEQKVLRWVPRTEHNCLPRQAKKNS
jgi:hypothetical protein